MGSSDPARFGDATVRAFLDALAAGRPAPSGGAATALAGALGAALVEMSAALWRDDAGAGARERAAAARERLLLAADDDAAEYATVLEAQRLPRERSDRAERVAAALRAAAEPPLAIAELAAEVAELAAGVAQSGKASLRGDATAGALLAEAAARTAARLVEINLATAGETGDAASRALAAAARAAAARERALALET